MEYISFLFALVLESQHLFLLTFFKAFPWNHMFVAEPQDVPH